ncbi:mCG146508, partial [Mus musculus]
EHGLPELLFWERNKFDCHS